MLIVCYGIPKSGSTLTFELVKGMLISIGHKQTRLPNTLVSEGHSVNFLEKVDPEKIDNLVAAVPPGGYLCIKTHAKIDRRTFRHLETLQAERKVQIIASYRDPRDICLSLVDAGERARAKGMTAFSRTTDIETAMPRVERQIASFRTWGAIKGTLRLGYDVVAFSPDKALDSLERVLGFTCGREAAKKHAFEEAFTQKNKAVRDRHATELTPEQKAELDETFGKFLRRVIERNDDQWFAAHRERFLSGRVGDARPNARANSPANA
jgi:hypothetical protein